MCESNTARHLQFGRLYLGLTLRVNPSLWNPAMVNNEFVLQSKAEEQGIEPGDLCKLSQAELSMRLGTDASMGTWRKTRGKGKVGNDI